MKVRDFLSKSITNFVAAQLPDKTETELEHIKYGIDVSLVNLLKLPFILLAAFLLGIFKYVIIAMFAFGTIRTFANGVHAKTSLGCFFITLASFLVIVYSAMFINLTLPVKVIIFLLSLALIYLYAPADNEERPFVEEKFRKRLRILAIISTIILFVFSVIIRDVIISNIIFYSIVIESILVTPLIYKIMKRGYRNYEKVQFD